MRELIGQFSAYAGGCPGERAIEGRRGRRTFASPVPVRRRLRAPVGAACSSSLAAFCSLAPAGADVEAISLARVASSRS